MLRHVGLLALVVAVVGWDESLSAQRAAAAERIAMRARSAEGRQELLMDSHRYHTELVENQAQAKQEQEEQGAGFKIKFVPQNSSVYDPTDSKTFKVIPNQV